MTEDTKNGFTEEVSEPCSEGAGVTLDDFVAYMPSHVYIFTPCREPWTQISVNARLPPVPVLDKHGRPKRVKGKLVTISASKWLDPTTAGNWQTHLKSSQIGVACDLSCVGEHAGYCGRWLAVLHLAIGQIAESITRSYTCPAATGRQLTHCPPTFGSQGSQETLPDDCAARVIG